MPVVSNGGAGGKLAEEICVALGLKHVQVIDIHMAVNEIFTVKAKFYPEIDGVKQLPAIIKKFQLVPIIEETTVIGDEIASFREAETAVKE